MISFQWITLSFLLVSGALFAYLIPYGPSYMCYIAHPSRGSDNYGTKAARTYFGQDY